MGADVTRTVQVKVSADSSAFDSGLKGTDKSIQGLGGAFGKLKGDMGGALGAVAPLGGAVSSFAAVALNPIALVGAAFAGLSVAAFGVGKDFQAATATIRAGTGATGAALDDLSKSAKNVFAKVPDDIGKVSSTLADLNTNLGITGAPLEALTKQFLDLEALPLGFSGNVQTLTRVFGDWAVATEDQTKTVDLMAVAAQATGVGVDKLATSVVQFGAPLREMGFSLAESTALVGKFTKEGVNTEAVLAGMKTALGKFGAAGQTGAEGLRTVIDQIKNAKSESEASKVAFETFGQRAGVDLKKAIQEGRFELEDLVELLEKSPDSVSKMRDSTKGLGDAWTELTKKATVLIEPLGTGMVNAMTAVVTAVNTHVGPAVDWLTGLFTSFGEQQSGLSATVSEAWAAITEATGGALASIQEAVSAGLAWIVAAWNEDFKGIRSAVEFAWDAIVAITDGLFTQIGGIISGGLTILSGAFQVVTGIITGDWEKFTGGLKTILAGALDAVLGIFTGAVQAILGVLGGLFDKIPGAEKVSAFLGDVSKDLDKTKKAIKDTADEWAGLGKEAEKAKPAAGVAKEIGKEAGAALKPVKDLGGAMKGAGGDAKDAAKEIEELNKKLEAANAPARFSMETFNELAKATEEYTVKVMAAAVAAAGLPPVFNDISASAVPAGAAITGFGVGLDEVNIKLKQSDADAGTLEGAYEKLGIKSQALKDKELAGLAQAVDDVKAAMDRGDASAEDLTAATEAYAKAAGTGGATKATEGFEKALTDLLGAAKGLGSDLLTVTNEGTVKFGLSLDGLKGKAVSLANEGIKLLIGKLTELIGLGPSVGSFGGILKNALGIGGSAASTVGGAGGGLGGAGGAAGAAGAVGGGLTATLGAIGSIGSAISGIIGNFQMKGMNKSLGLIEESTRRSMIHLGEGGSSILDWTQSSQAILWIIANNTAVLKDGITLAPGATLPVTKAVEDGSDAQVAATEKGTQSIVAGNAEARAGRALSEDVNTSIRAGNEITRSMGGRSVDALELIGSSIDTGTDVARQSRDAIVASIVALPEGIGREVGERVSSGGRNPDFMALPPVPKHSALGRTEDFGPGMFYRGRRIGPGFIDPGESNRIARGAEEGDRPIIVNVTLDGEPISSRVSEIQAGRLSLQR